MRTFFVLSIALSAVLAQPSPAGKWTVNIEAASGETDAGGTWSRSALTGTFDIEQAGEALTGSWAAPRGEPWPFTGQFKGEAFELTTTVRDVPVVIDGQKTTARFRWIFSGTVAGESLRGSARFEREAERSGSVQPFTATRRQ
jgi:hypothetical protein